MQSWKWRSENKFIASPYSHLYMHYVCVEIDVHTHIHMIKITCFEIALSCW